MCEEIHQIWVEHKDDKDHWIQYVSIYYSDDMNNCIWIVMLEENRDHLPEVKKHLKKYPVKYRFAPTIEVSEQTGAKDQSDIERHNLFVFLNKSFSRSGVIMTMNLDKRTAGC